MLRLATLLLVPTLLLAGCGGSDGADDRSAPRPATSATPTTTPSTSSPSAPSARPQVIGTVADHLEVPWGIACLPDGSALVTERDSGRVLQITGQRVTEVGRVEEAEPNGEAGLLGVAVS